MKAIEACRCSPSSGPISSSCARSGAGTAISSGMPSTAGSGSTVPRTSGAARSRRPSPFSSPSESSPSARAVSALTRISPASDVASISTVCVAAGPVTSSSRWPSPTRKNWKRPEWRPACIFSWIGAGRRPRASDRAERPAHLEGRTCCPGSVLLALVEQQERVSAELEEPASLRVRDSEERREGRVHDLGHLFGACLAEAGELLGHRREAGDVDERDRSVDFAPDRRPARLGATRGSAVGRTKRARLRRSHRAKQPQSRSHSACRLADRQSAARARKAALRNVYRSSTQSPQKGDVRYVQLDE